MTTHQSDFWERKHMTLAVLNVKKTYEKANKKPTQHQKTKTNI